MVGWAISFFQLLLLLSIRLEMCS